MLKFSCLMFLFSSLMYANMGPTGFHPFNKNRVFVETGTYRGRGILQAIEAGFEEIHSFENWDKFYKMARKSFKRHRKQVFLHFGDSATELWGVISKIDRPITFWLDAHDATDPKSKPFVKNSPLMEELDQIQKHPIKDHIILIDDMDLCGGYMFDYITEDQIKQKILEINPQYKFSYLDGGDLGRYKNTILVAQVL